MIPSFFPSTWLLGFLEFHRDLSPCTKGNKLPSLLKNQEISDDSINVYVKEFP